MTESSTAGNDFLAKICIDWEKAALAAPPPAPPCEGGQGGVRVVLLGTGVVLDIGGGALAKMLLPFKMGVGGPIGSGKQFMSWIHNEDEVGLILYALDHPEISGPLNATAPVPVTNKEFSTALGKVLGRPSFMPTPGFALHIMLGESRKSSLRASACSKDGARAGYAFKFPEVEARCGTC